jgi:hypothetical protein
MTTADELKKAQREASQAHQKASMLTCWSGRNGPEAVIIVHGGHARRYWLRLGARP